MDEMGHGWTDIAFMNDEQYDRYQAGESLLRRNVTDDSGQ